MLKQSLINVEKNCPRKIRDKEHSAEQNLTKCPFLREEDVNEFLECHLEKVSSGGSKVRGDNCDTRLNKRNRFFYNIHTDLPNTNLHLHLLTHEESKKIRRDSL